MTPEKIIKRNGRVGWRFRFTDPVLGRRTRKIFWLRGSAKKEADGWQAFNLFMAERERVALGLPDSTGWKRPWSELVDRFLREAPLSTPARRTRLKTILGRNELQLRNAGDLINVGRLTIQCRELAATLGDHYVLFSLQRVLKQVSRWAASSGVSMLPSDPLATWSRLPWSGRKKIRRSFLPPEMNAILDAADEYDAMSIPAGRRWKSRNDGPAQAGHKYPSRVVFETLFFTANRPGVVFEANVSQLAADRIVLPPGNGKKRNGLATLPPEYMPTLQIYCADRTPTDPLLVSHEGERVNMVNMSRYFKRCMTLAFVRMEWPQDDLLATHIEPVEIAYLLYNGRQKGFEGAPPKPGTQAGDAKIKARRQHTTDVEALAAQLGPRVAARLKDRDMYCLRKTHKSWADQTVNRSSIRMQMGHAADGADDQHYLDLVDPHLSSAAVWAILTGARQLSQAEPSRMVASGEMVPRMATEAHEQKNAAGSATTPGSASSRQPKTYTAMYPAGFELATSAFAGHSANKPDGTRSNQVGSSIGKKSKQLSVSNQLKPSHRKRSGPQSGQKIPDMWTLTDLFASATEDQLAEISTMAYARNDADNEAARAAVG